ncbi:branched-chain amino acid ABC transporter permease [Salinisphaera sp. RV14]|uniref:branched-chain amino acid ABC transporter permease n=1 Tax=unclassified Salinisphaera TaxID=2649847 RepID=UPI003F8693E6
MNATTIPGKSPTANGARAATAAIDLPRLVSALVIWALLLTVPFWLPLVGGYTVLGTRVLIFALVTLGLNLLLGFTGGLSFGHAAYFGLGAYGTGLMLKFVSPSTPLAILVGVLAGGLAATLFGPLTVRRKGIYFAMITIAIGQMFYFIAVRWNSLTGGEDGLTGFSRTNIHFGNWVLNIHDPTNFYYFTLFFFAIGCLVVWMVLRSPLGHTFVAIRENPRRLRFLGLPIGVYIWIAFAISGFVAALAGALYALLNNFTSPEDMNWILSGDFVIICVLGGMRTFWGPLVGSVIYVVVQDYLSSITVNWMSFIGAIFVLSVLFFPWGLLGFFQGRFNK